jgi:hypothetical protein
METETRNELGVAIDPNDPVIDPNDPVIDPNVPVINPNVPAAVEGNSDVNTRTTCIDMSEKDTVVQVSKTKSVIVRKAKLNPLAVTNIIEKGREKIRQLDIPAIRFRQKCRIKRERKTLQQELDHYLASRSGSTKFSQIMNSLKEVNTSDLRVEYRLMMKQMWIEP